MASPALSAPDRVLVWASQLAANDFPPVCAMTGQPAETWKKFTFSRTPWWSFMFGLFGAALFSSRAAGHLPLTRSSSRRVSLYRSAFVGLIAVAVGLWIASAVVAPNLQVDATRGAIGAWLFWAGLLGFLVAVIGIVFWRNAFGPTGKVLEPVSGETEKMVELKRVHPAFVFAVTQAQQARAAQLAALAPPPPPPA